MSNLSELLPAGAGAKSAEFVASGTLSSGQTVVLNSDGTVSSVNPLGPPVVGSSVVFEVADTAFPSSAFDSNSNKVVIAYRDQGNSFYGTAVVGTVSGTSITFGTAVVFESAEIFYTATTFDSDSNKIVIAYEDRGNVNRATAIVGTVSGTSISFGSAAEIPSVRLAYPSATFDSNSNKVVIAFQDASSSNYGKAVVGTVSGTSISFGGDVTFDTANSNSISATFDSNLNKVVIAYRDSDNFSYGNAVVGTVSGTSISFGTVVVFNSASTFPSAIFDSNSNKVVIAYSGDGGNSSFGNAVVGTVSGTSVSFGSPTVFAVPSGVSGIFGPVAAFDSNSNKVVIAYSGGGVPNYARAVVGTVSGTSTTFGTAVVFESAAISYLSTVFDPVASKVIFSYADVGNSSYGTSTIFQATSTNSADFIGITDQAIADTATGAVIVQGGVSEKVTGLTTGSDYYVQDDGSLSTTVSSVPAGRALSSTSILLEG